MGRAERRRQGIQEKPKTYVLTDQQIRQLKEDATRDAINGALACIVALPIKIMREYYGWGKKKRLPELADLLIDAFEEFYDGKITSEELAAELHELDIKIERRR